MIPKSAVVNVLEVVGVDALVVENVELKKALPFFKTTTWNSDEALPTLTVTVKVFDVTAGA